MSILIFTTRFRIFEGISHVYKYKKFEIHRSSNSFSVHLMQIKGSIRLPFPCRTVQHRKILDDPLSNPPGIKANQQCLADIMKVILGLSWHASGARTYNRQVCFRVLILSIWIAFRFIIVCQGSSSAVVPGHALVMDSEKQFAPLAKFGSSFLNRQGVNPGAKISCGESR